MLNLIICHNLCIFFYRFNLVTAEPECDALSAIINLSGSFAVGVSHLSDLFVRRADSDQRSSLGSSLEQRLERFEISFSVLLLSLHPRSAPRRGRCLAARGIRRRPDKCVHAHTRTQPTLTFIESVRKRSQDMTKPL